MADIESFSETEEQIFQAALKEFARYGKKGARMQDIANEAGCNKALVHYYFRNKEKLFEKVSDHIFTELFSAIHDAVTDAPTFKEMLTAFVGTYINYLKKYGVYPLLMYKGMDHDDLKRRHQKIVAHFGAAPSKLLLDKIKEAVKNGEIRDVDPDQTYMSIMGSCIYLFVAYPVLALSNEKLEKNLDQIIKERKKYIVDLIYNGLKKNED